MKIIIAIDESDHCKLLVRDIAQRKWTEETEFMLLNVIESSPFDLNAHLDANQLKQVKRTGSERSNDLLDDAATYLRENVPKSCRIHRASAEGRPAMEIVRVATDWGADLIVVGSHDRRGLSRLVLGSVAEAVMMHAPCSVELSRHQHVSQAYGELEKSVSVK